ncbi:MAG: hypothetical protein H6745_20340 [Deltaproteobacteria bacterium]|nr:hypothetical protein [Deltaproteobacteria bacterium]
MSTLALGWIVSIVGAAAFAALGFVLGRRRASGEVTDVVAEGVAGEGAAAMKVAVSVPRSGRFRRPGGGATSREEQLTALLAELAPARGGAVLADSEGLAMASAGESDPDGIAAIAGMANILFARVDELLHGGRAVRADLRLSDGRTLQLRPVGEGDDASVVLVVGDAAPDDARFAPVGARIAGLVAGTAPAGA